MWSRSSSSNICRRAFPRRTGICRSSRSRSSAISARGCPIEEWVKADETGDIAVLRNKIIEALAAAYETKRTTVGAEIMRYIEKEVMLRTLDQHWREHLAAMDYMRQGIFLRSYAQKNPKQEYKREAFELFSAMLDRIKFDTVTTRVQDPGAQPGGDRARGARAPAAARARAAAAARGGGVADPDGGRDRRAHAADGNPLEVEPMRGPRRRRPILRTAAPRPRRSCARCRRWDATSCVPADRARSTSTATAPCSKRAVDGVSREHRRSACRQVHVAAAVLIDAARPRADRAAAAGQAPGGRLGVSGRQARAGRDAAPTGLARELARSSASRSSIPGR